MRKSKYTYDFLAPICAAHFSTAAVIKYLGLEVTGGNYRHIRKRIAACGIDTSHFTGMLWNKGETKDTHPALKKASVKTSYTKEEVFASNSAVSGNVVRKLFLKEDVVYKCAFAECGISEWQGKTLTLHLDHIDGNHTNNILSNLRWLCPNCHQQTDTWGNKKCAAVMEQEDSSVLDTEAKLSSVRVRTSPAAPRDCIDCHKKISKKSTRCKSCAAKSCQPTKIIWPSRDELLERLSKSNYLALGKELGVSDNAIRKRLRD